MISRRTAVLGLGSALAGCGRGESPAPLAAPRGPSDAAPPGPPEASSRPSSEPSAPPASAAPTAGVPEIVTRELHFDASEGGPQHCVLVTPRVTDGRRLPLLVALHGLGEARKGLEAGAWGWVRDYWLDRAMARLFSPPLVADDLRGFVRADRLAALNGRLAARPFSGLAVACLYTPDLLTPRSLDNARAFGRFVVERALPRLRREPDVDPSRTGLDGVSLGGRLALLVGLAHPKEFQAVGALQAALQLSEARELARRVRRAREQNPTLALRLVTSERDFYKDEIGALHAELERVGLAHEHDVLPGPHDYPWNRGPGAVEMLMFHSRALGGG